MKSVVFVFIACSIYIPFQAQENNPDRVLEAIRTGATYAAEKLLDETGKSRCDYNMTEGRWHPYEEPWHTGQVINALLAAYEVTQYPGHLSAAQRAGDWWVTLEIVDHSQLTGMVRAIHGDDAGEVIVFATVTDGTPGLFRLWKVTGEKKYAEVPTRAGAWMLENMCDLEEGICYDNVDPVTGKVYKESSPFHADKNDVSLFDVSRPNTEGSLFLDMYRFNGEKKYLDAFLSLCNSLVEKQDEHGLWMRFMPNHPAQNAFHPRFNLWYAESLINAFEETGNQKYLVAAKKTVDRYLAAQRGDGTIFYKNYLNGEADPGSICGSAVAFTGLLMMRLGENGVQDDYTDRINLCARWLIRNQFQADHPDPNLAGAFLNIRKRNRKGKIWLVNRDVGTSFALRFLSKYYQHRFGKK
ncbi:MAG: glycoside hydrolase family 127 protein [Saprospiraceae bacterium]|nr:glycoside hydrolase family 127 protein [Saprospiraceae bacterium]